MSTGVPEKGSLLKNEENIRSPSTEPHWLKAYIQWGAALFSKGSSDLQPIYIYGK
jgi:hypothetical protein